MSTTYLLLCDNGGGMTNKTILEELHLDIYDKLATSTQTIQNFAVGIPLRKQEEIEAVIKLSSGDEQLYSEDLW